MTDVLSLAIFVAFFAVAVAFVYACERIVGPDVESESTFEADEAEQAAA